MLKIDNKFGSKGNIWGRACISDTGCFLYFKTWRFLGNHPSENAHILAPDRRQDVGQLCKKLDQIGCGIFEQRAKNWKNQKQLQLMHQLTKSHQTLAADAFRAWVFVLSIWSVRLRDWHPLTALTQLFWDQISWFFLFLAELRKKSNLANKKCHLILSADVPQISWQQLTSAVKIFAHQIWFLPQFCKNQEKSADLVTKQLS